MIIKAYAKGGSGKTGTDMSRDGFRTAPSRAQHNTTQYQREINAALREQGLGGRRLAANPAPRTGQR